MTKPVFDIEDILKLIPHRYPFLLIDRVESFEKNVSLIAKKNITMNEPQFMGHFPDKPVMPGVLIIEAMAQAACILASQSMEEDTDNKLVYFMSIDNAKFRKPVVPGDTVYFHIEKHSSRGPVWKCKAVAKVDDQKVAEALVSAMVVDKEKKHDT